MTTETTRTSYVVVESVGPVRDRLTIDLSRPGVVELRGGCGSGKTHVLQALRSLLGYDTDWTPKPTWGANRGSVEGLGGRTTFGQRSSGAGSADVPRLPVDALVRFISGGGFKTADARTKARVDALFELYPVAATAEHVRALLAGDVELLELPVDDEEDPPNADSLASSAANPAQAAETLRSRLLALRAAARSEADKTAGSIAEVQARAEVVRERVGDEATSDEDLATVEADVAALERRVEREAGRRDSRVKSEEAAEKSRAILDEQFGGGRAAIERRKAVAEDEWNAVRHQLDELEEEKADLERRLDEVKASIDAGERSKEAAGERKEQAEADLKRFDTLRDTIHADLSEIGPSEEEMQSLRAQLADRRADLERAKAAQEHEGLRERLAALEEQRTTAATLQSRIEERVEGLRSQLSEILAGVGIPHVTVADGQLYLRDEDGEPDLELDPPNVSAGELVNVALDLFLLGAPSADGPPRPFVLDATARASLEPSFLEALQAGCVARGLVCITEVTTNGPLRVVPLAAQGAEREAVHA